MTPLTHASVFSGIGGPEVAAVMLGWRNPAHQYTEIAFPNANFTR